jgi:2-polyprenyl-6-methoxyphenol hydroxylase-like FAD-dependent oxidoreductase
MIYLFMAAIVPNLIPKVLVVGAGPVGLWTAVQAKLLNPELPITVLERYDNYLRSHVLSLSSRSFKGIPKDPRLQALVKEFLTTKNVKTNTIEEKLEGLAKELGIDLQKNVEVKDPRSLRAMYPNAKVIVGADGAHSTVRKEIFNNEIDDKGDLKYIVDVKYEVVGQGKRLDFVKGVYPTLKKMGAIAQEYVGREKEGKTAITLRLFIDRKKYEHMQDANFKHPYTFANEELIHEEVSKNIHLWMNIKAQMGEVRVPDSEKITVTRLGIYSSKKVVKEEEEVTWCLVGDAAFGVPFFRSLNNGLSSGTALAKAIVRSLLPEEGIIDRKFRLIGNLFKQAVLGPFVAYSLYVRNLAKAEILWARIKSLALSLLLWFVQISARVPWQSNYWTEAQIRVLQN